MTELSLSNESRRCICNVFPNGRDHLARPWIQNVPSLSLYIYLILKECRYIFPWRKRVAFLYTRTHPRCGIAPGRNQCEEKHANGCPSIKSWLFVLILYIYAIWYTWYIHFLALGMHTTAKKNIEYSHAKPSSNVLHFAYISVDRNDYQCDRQTEDRLCVSPFGNSSAAITLRYTVVYIYGCFSIMLNVDTVDIIFCRYDGNLEHLYPNKSVTKCKQQSLWISNSFPWKQG